MAHENNPDYMQLPLFRIVVDGMYYCGELVSNAYTFNDPFSSNSFHTAPGGKTTLEFSENHEKAKLIEGRNNLASHVKRVIEFVTCASDMPKEIKIERSPFPIPLTMNIDYFLDIESENTKLKAKIAELTNENPWIPISSGRLPNKFQECIVLDSGGHVHNWIHDDALLLLFARYTYWMPLPQPPEVQS
jgi:hypothetical protein